MGSDKRNGSSIFFADDESSPLENFASFKSGSDNLFLEYGQDESFYPLWHNLAASGVVVTVRQALGELRKTRHDGSKPKTIQFHIKTAVKGPYIGHLPIPSSWRLVEQREEISTKDDTLVLRNIYEDSKGNQEEVCVTNERQDLRFIETAFRTDLYRIDSPDDIVLPKDGKDGFIVFKATVVEEVDGVATDVEKSFMIRLSEENLKKNTGMMIAPVKTLRKLFEKVKLSRGKSNTSASTVEGKLTQLFESEFWINNYSSTLPIFPCSISVNPNDEPPVGCTRIGMWDVDARPNIACSPEGVPIKGDIDQRNCIISSALPLPEALALLGTKELDINDPELMTTAINQFRELRAALAELGGYEFLIKSIDDTINRLEKHRAEHPNDIKAQNAMIVAAGNIEVINAIFIIGSDIPVEHGSDGVSPLLPENFGAEHIILADGTVVETYGEFEYLKCLLMLDEFADKIINLNTCGFVPLTEFNPSCRKDEDVETRSRDKSLVSYNNRSDEELSILLHELLYERQLLKLKQSGKLEDYLKVHEANHAIQLERAKKSGRETLVLALEAGREVQERIIAKVRATSDEDIEDRLVQIKGLHDRSSMPHASSTGPSVIAGEVGSSEARRPLKSRPSKRGAMLPSYTSLKSMKSSMNLRSDRREEFDADLRKNLQQLLHANKPHNH